MKKRLKQKIKKCCSPRNDLLWLSQNEQNFAIANRTRRVRSQTKEKKLTHKQTTADNVKTCNEDAEAVIPYLKKTFEYLLEVFGKRITRTIALYCTISSPKLTIMSFK